MEVEDILILQQGIDYLTNELLEQEWIAKTPEDLDILWNGIKNPEWTGAELLRKRLAWLKSRLMFRPHLIGKKRERLREAWLLRNSTELYLRYVDSRVDSFWGSTHGPVKEFNRFWENYFPLGNDSTFIEEKLEPLVAKLTDEELFTLTEHIARCCDDYRLALASSIRDKFQLLPIPDCGDAKLARKQHGKRKTVIEAEGIMVHNHQIKVMAVFLVNYVLNQKALNEILYTDNCIAADFRQYVREGLYDSYYDAWNHFQTGALEDGSSSYYNWKTTHPREYSLFMNEAFEAVLRAMYNYNHPNEPLIVKYEPNFMELNNFSMSIEPIIDEGCQQGECD